MRRFGEQPSTRELLTAVVRAMTGVQGALTGTPELDTFLTGDEELDEELQHLEQRVADMFVEAGSISGRASILIDDYTEAS